MLKQYKTKDQKGFTIIEVLIVLAIAGLILLIVFLAVPALQRNSRNTQRKTDIGRIGSAATTVIANSNGNVATGLTRANLVAEVGNNLSIYDFSVAANLVVNVEASGGTAVLQHSTLHAKLQFCTQLKPATAPLLSALTSRSGA
jgi:prepilin-type N-terminal cleavage/methylation domain-containing protein